MLKIVKKTIKILLVLILVLCLAAVSIPFLFKDKIKAKLLTEIDKNINARVDFSELSFSSIKKFPHFAITLHNPSVIGINEFAGDTFIDAKEISISLNIYKLIKGQGIEIRSIDLEDPLIYARINKSGKANYDIAKTDTSTKTTSTGKSVEVAIDKWAINNGRIVYDDKLQKTYIEIGGLYHSGSGDFKQEISDLDLTTKVNDLTVEYNGIRYFTKKLFAADLQMEMNLKEKKFIFKDHNFQLGEFKFGFAGYFKLLDSGYETDLKFIVAETNFKNLLSLLPGIYQKDLKGIETKGNFACNGFIKGVYDVKDNKVPAFHIDLKVIDALFKYSHLPKALEKINFDFVADNPDGNPEHSTYNLKTFHVEINKEPIHGSLCVKGKKHMYVTADIKLKADLAEIEKMYPIDGLVLRGILNSEIKVNGRYSDSLKLFPNVDAFFNLEKGYVKSKSSPLDMDSIQFNAEVVNNTGQIADTRVSLNNLTFLLDDEPFVMSGTVSDLKDYTYNIKADGLLDLAKLTQIYPIANTSLKGTLNFDLSAEGNLTEIEAKQYAQLKTNGTLEAKNVSYKNTDIAFPIHIDDALFTFTPDKIVLNRFQAEFGKGNVTLSGHLYNYIPYIIKNNAPIKGDLTMYCDTLDLNEWFPSSVSTNTTQVTKRDTTKATASSNNKQPEVLVIPGNIGFVIDSDIKMVKFGQMDIANLNGEIRVENGILTLNETGFNTLDSKMSVSGDYNTRDNKHPLFDLDVNIDKLDFNKAYKTFVDPKGTCPAAGNFSTKYAIKGELTPGFSPIYSTLIGSGNIIIDSVSVKGMKLMNHIKNVSKKEEFKDPKLADVTITTEIKKGKVLIYPFTFKVSKFLTEVEGEQGLEDETINYSIKLSVPPFSRLKIPISIKGTSDKPIIKMGKGFDNSDFDKL
ncbi:MAG TPA: AsmA-like C-terminal region-containing protein [Bacteroidia bacterium]|nr:AsmA-like C-terminal region-containing protein [Bacteroidia bacterium]